MPHKLGDCDAGKVHISGVAGKTFDAIEFPNTRSAQGELPPRSGPWTDLRASPEHGLG